LKVLQSCIKCRSPSPHVWVCMWQNILDDDHFEKPPKWT